MKHFWLACLLLSTPVLAQPLTPDQRREVTTILRDALRSDPSILRDAIEALQADDARHQEAAAREAIRALHSQLIDPADPAAGNPSGDVTVVEFYDTHCPYCRRMMPENAELLRLDPGVRLIYKDLPVLGPASVIESRALLAAQQQGGYFKLQDVLMRNTAAQNADTLRDGAERVGLDGTRLVRDMEDPAIKVRLDANTALARRLGIQGTPALVIGDKLIPGAVSLAELRAAIATARGR